MRRIGNEIALYRERLAQPLEQPIQFGHQRLEPSSRQPALRLSGTRLRSYCGCWTSAVTPTAAATRAAAHDPGDEGDHHGQQHDERYDDALAAAALAKLLAHLAVAARFLKDTPPAAWSP